MGTIHRLKDGYDGGDLHIPPLLVLFSDQQPRAGHINPS